jgi:tetratricopeptide (TPR) repeat protein
LLSGDVIVKAEIEESTVATTGSKKKSKKTSKKAKTQFVATLSTVPNSYDVPMTRDQFWEELQRIAKSRFLYNGLLLMGHRLSPRISPLVFLRRICQTCGLRVLCKKYNFTEGSPFMPSDIQELFPIVKDSVPLVTFHSGMNLITTAIAEKEAGNYGLAFELAKVLIRWTEQVTGPHHKLYCKAYEIIADVLIKHGDTIGGITALAKKLALDVQLYGLDSKEAVEGHSTLGGLYYDINNFEAAVSHLQTALYLLKLMVGNSHPKIVNLYFHLGSIFRDNNRLDSAMALFEAGESMVSTCCTFESMADIYAGFATVLSRMNNYKEAIEKQKQAYVIDKEIFGEDHVRTMRRKDMLAFYIHDSVEHNAQLMQEKADEERSEKVNNATSLWLEHDSMKKKKSGSKKKSSKKKGK